jgi:hypothetical protein
MVPEDQAFLWLNALESAAQIRNWDGIQAQLVHIRSELERMSSKQ